MKNFGLLLKAVSGSLSNNAVLKNGRRKNKSAFSSLILTQAFVGVILAVTFGFSIFTNYQAMSLFLTPELNNQYISLTFSSSFIAVLGYSCTYVTSAFFFSKSDDYFLALPVKPWMLFLARFVLAMIFSLSFSFLIFAESLIFSIVYQPAFSKILGSIVIFITVPIIAVSISFFLMNTLGKLFNMRAHKWVSVVFTVVFMLVAVASLYLLSFLGIDSTEGNTTAELVASSIQGRYQATMWMNWIGYIPGIILSSSGGEAYLYMLYQILIAVGALGLGLLSAKLFYIKNLGSFGTKKKKALGASFLEEKTHKSFMSFSKSQYKAEIKREFKLRMSNGAVFMNTVFLPVFFGVMALFVILMLRYLAVDTNNVSIFDNLSIATSAIASAAVFEGMLPTSSYLSFSLEGKSFASIMSMPIDRKVYIKAKVFVNNALPVGIGLALVIIGTLACQVNPLVMLIAAFGAIPFILFSNELGLILGIKFARFNWDNVVEINQRGFGPFLLGIFSYLAVIIGCGGMIGLALVLPSNLFFMPSLILGIVSIIGFIILRYFTLKQYDKLLASDISF